LRHFLLKKHRKEKHTFVLFAIRFLRKIAKFLFEKEIPQLNNRTPTKYNFDGNLQNKGRLNWNNWVNFVKLYYWCIDTVLKEAVCLLSSLFGSLIFYLVSEKIKNKFAKQLMAGDMEIEMR
jgi:hypothetical protein